MTTEHVLRTTSELKALAEHLATCPEVTRFDQGREREAWALAHSFADLESSFRRILEEQLPRLTGEELPPRQIYSLLLDNGEELRHILYHVKDPKFYGYLQDEPSTLNAHG